MSNSRFLQTDIVVDNEIDRYGEWKPPILPSTDEGVQMYVATERDIGNPDIMAYEAYGDETLWWYILEWNKIYDPFTIQVGDRIKIPPKPNLTFDRDRYVVDIEEEPKRVEKILPYSPPQFRQSSFVPTVTEDETTDNTPTAFNFGFPVPEAVTGLANFQMQVATDVAFSDLVAQLNTSVTVQRWQYYNHLANSGEGEHQDFPVGGIDAEIYAGQSVYYQFPVGDLINGSTYYFRYRAVVGDIETQWFSPPAVIV